MEAIAIKQVYRRAKNHLLTASEEANQLQSKIADGNIAGLDSCVLVQKPEFDRLLKQLRSDHFTEAEAQSPIEKGTVLPVK